MFTAKQAEATAAALAAAAAAATGPKPSEVKKPPPKPEYLRPDLKKASELSIWRPRRNDGFTNKYRYEAGFEILGLLKDFQEAHLEADPASISEEKLTAWNGIVAAVRNDLEKSIVAEQDELGWKPFTDSAKRMKFSDPDLAKQYDENVKYLKEQDSSRKRKNASNSQPFPARGGGRPVSHHHRNYSYNSNNGGGRFNRGPVPSTSKSGKQHGTLCYNCSEYGHIGKDCPQPDKRKL